MTPNRTPYEAMVYAEYPSWPGISPHILLEKDPDKMVLKNVEPKKSPAANNNHRVGWTLSHAPRAGMNLNDWKLPADPRIVSLVIDDSNIRLLIAHSKDQSRVINPANERSNATFGTSK